MEILYKKNITFSTESEASNEELIQKEYNLRDVVLTVCLMPEIIETTVVEVIHRGL